MPLPEVVLVEPLPAVRHRRPLPAVASRRAGRSNGARAFWGLAIGWLVASAACGGHWLESGARRRGATAQAPAGAPALRLSAR